jgi:hypothetical protein
MAGAAIMLVPLAAAPAFSKPEEQENAKVKLDPNQIVCERQEELGTRLGGRKVCKTRAEWAEERHLTRQDLEKVQVQRGCKDGSC